MVAKAASGKRKTGRALNAENLTSIGAPRLASLLMELTASDAGAKRRLRLELAVQAGPEVVAKLSRTRLGALAKATTSVSWKQAPVLVAELEAHHHAIMSTTAREKPALAIELLWLLIGAAISLLDRSGRYVGVHEEAIRQLGELASVARPDAETLAEDAFRALVHAPSRNLPVIAALAPCLGAAGLAHLKRRLGERDPHGRAEREALLAIADAEGDVDEYLRLHPAEERRKASHAAAIAQRLVAAGRAGEALKILDAATGKADPEHSGGRPVFDWSDARIAALEALHRHAEAHRERRDCFDRALSVEHLRAWLRQFPDTFDAMDQEEQAFDQAEKTHPAGALLEFFIEWPDLGRASALVLLRAKELERRPRWRLEAAAEALAARYPLAATLVLRVALESCLRHRPTSRTDQRESDRETVRLFRDLAGLARENIDYGAHPTHGVYVSWLRGKHPYADHFWSEVKKTAPRA